MCSELTTDWGRKNDLLGRDKSRLKSGRRAFILAHAVAVHFVGLCTVRSELTFCDVVNLYAEAYFVMMHAEAPFKPDIILISFIFRSG